MKKLLIFSLVIMILLVGCSTTPTQPSSSNVAEPSVVIRKESVEGSVKETYIEENKKYIELKAGKDVLKLDASNVQDFETIAPEEFYRIVFEGETKTIIDITKINVIPATAQPLERNKRIIQVEPTLDLDGLNPFKVADISSFPEFGIPKIVLYTDAVKDEQGSFHWDDGNRFVLIAHTVDSGYILFNERIQLGGMDVNVYSLEGVLYIASMDTATADINFRIYELINGKFEEDIIFDGQGNINMLYTSN